MEKLIINIPTNQEIDWQESAKQEKIVFKQKVFKPKSWEEYCKNIKHIGYYIDLDSQIECIEDNDDRLDDGFDRNLLPTYELAKSFLAMMQLMTLRQAWVGDWKPNWAANNLIWCILFVENRPVVSDVWTSRPLSFPSNEMAKEFVECFKDLINEARILL